MSLLRDFETIRPSFEPLFDRFVRNFTGLGIPKGERLGDLNVEVVLSPEEAAQGIVVPLNIPVFLTCVQCGGSGRDWLFLCVECNGQGIIEEEKTVRVRIPPRVGDRTVIEVPIHGLGIHNFHLRLLHPDFTVKLPIGLVKIPSPLQRKGFPQHEAFCQSLTT